MAQPWPAIWRIYTKNNLPVEDPTDEAPSCTDIVGNSNFPAAYFQYDGIAIFFRIRLQTTPLQGGRLVQFNWGVLFDTNNNPQSYEWLITVNGRNSCVEIWQNFVKHPTNSFADAAEGLHHGIPFVPNYKEAVVLGANVRVVPVDDGSSFGKGNNIFLDFQIPFSTLSALFNITEFTPIRLFYYTSSTNRTINKDLMGGNPLTLSSGFGDLTTLNPSGPLVGGFSIIKKITAGPLTTYVNAITSWRFEIVVENMGVNPIDNVIVSNTALLENIVSIRIISITKGIALAVGDVVNWSLDTVAPGERNSLIISLTGSFTANGRRSLTQSYGNGTDPIWGMITGGPATGAGITVLAGIEKPMV